MEWSQLSGGISGQLRNLSNCSDPASEQYNLGGKQMRQYEMYEIAATGKRLDANQVKIDLDVMVAAGEDMKILKAFYDGENEAGEGIYKVRIYSEKTGQYEIKTKENEYGVSIEKTLMCEAGESDSIYHGMVQAYETHFRYADGTWFYPFGTTIYALAHQPVQVIEQTFETLEKNPFNKVRMCIFPKHYDFNKNDPEFFPFQKDEDGKWDVNRPDFEFWHRMDRHIERLNALEIQCDLILFHPYDKWGFSKLNMEDALTYLDYVIRRYAAMPNIWWSLANEYDLLDYEKEDWEQFAQYLHEKEPWHHLLSCHQIVTPWDFSNQNTTHICHQSGDVDRVGIWIKEFGKPLMIDETGYEGNIPFDWGNLSAFEMVNRFWITVAQGGYCTHGETLSKEDGLLWWAMGGTLIGESPERIRFLKEIIDSLPGPLSYCGRYMDEAKFNEYKKIMKPEDAPNNLVKLMLKLPWEKAQFLAMAGREYESCYGEQVYLKYYARHCTSIGKLQLPENKTYQVEMIDVWEMTRTTLLEGASGAVEMKLPGKEGIALLATEVEA